MTEMPHSAESTLPGMRIALSSPDFNLVGGVERVAVEASNRLARGGIM